MASVLVVVVGQESMRVSGGVVSAGICVGVAVAVGVFVDVAVAVGGIEVGVFVEVGCGVAV